MSGVHAWTLLAALLSSLTVAGVFAQGQQPTFRSRVSLVRLDVLVVDEGRPISGLTAADFEVLDNGVPQTIAAVDAGVSPLDVVFVLDRSDSVRGETLNRLKEAVHATLRALRETDRAALLTFSQWVRLDAPFQAERAELARAVDEVTASGGTLAIDAVHGALAVAEGTGRRTLVLLFSDGLDNLSWLTPDAVVAEARGSEAVICGVAFVPPSDLRARRSVSAHVELLNRLSGATGGEVVEIRQQRDLAPTFVRLLNTMRARYLFTYTPAGAETPGWHELKVRLKRGSGNVVARPGYFVR